MNYDLVLLHAPSVYDFRKKPLFAGPISDVVPSSYVFEMYPIGLTTIAEFLEGYGLRVKIINIANRMLMNQRFDVEKKLRNIHTQLFGIDLHWLPHVHGSIEIAKILKNLHPETPILFGGLSATYYHQELIEYPCIDFVLRGDSTEKLVLLLVNKILAGNTSFEDIPNLTWKRGEERGYNPLTYVPANMDDFEIPGYRYTIRSVFKYRNLLDPLPYQGWLQYPNTALLTARGCTQKCLICGGSKKAYEENCNRHSLALRSPRKLIEDIQFISRFSRAPVFIIHDLRQEGQDYVDDFCQRLKCIKLKNELVFELFQEADESFFRKINESVPHYSIEITLESHDERLRQNNGKFSCSNLKVIDTLQFALKHGCEKIDLFFMVGIPGQTYQSALKNINFCEEIHITCNQDKRLCYFVAPLAPFLDPASAAFENPEIYGYKKLCHTLEDYRQVINQPSWKQMLSYETTEMTRDDLVNATYDSARKLNDFKFKYGLIDLKVYRDLDLKIAKSKTYITKIDKVLALPKEQQAAEFSQIQKEIADLNKYSICAKNELKWEVKKNYANPFSIAVLGIQLLYEDYRNRLRNRLNPKRRELFKLKM